jgi:hypothetical protein
LPPILFSGLPAGGSVLDDSAAPPRALLEARTKIVEPLRKIGFNVERLVDQLEELPHRLMLLRERRRDRVQLEWRRRRPLARQTVELAKKAALANVSEDLVLEYENLADRAYAPSRIADQLAGGVASERARLQLHIAPGANTKAIQKRFMPVVARIVYNQIFPALERRHLAMQALPASKKLKKPVRYAGRELGEHPGPEARLLTSDFLRAFFPLWGAKMTPEKVQDAIRRLGSAASSGKTKGHTTNKVRS